MFLWIFSKNFLKLYFHHIFLSLSRLNTLFRISLVLVLILVYHLSMYILNVSCGILFYYQKSLQYQFMFSKSTKLIGLGLIVAASIPLIYYMYKRKQKQVVQPEIFVISEPKQQDINAIIKQIRQIQTQQPLQKQGQIIKKIYAKSNQLIENEFIKLSMFYRKKRRAVAENTQKYIELIKQFLDKTKELKDMSLNLILAQLDLSQQKWSEIVLNWSSYNEQEWDECIADNELLVKIKNPVNKIINMKELFNEHKKILEILGENKQKYKFDKTPKEQILTILNIIVDDQIYKKYNIQNEEIKQIINNMKEQEYQELTNLMNQIQLLTLGFIEQDPEEQPTNQQN